LTGAAHGHIIMTMARKRTMAAGTFKAECLAVLDRVAATGEPVVVTKRGRPVAEVVPVRTQPPRPLRGSVKTRGDLVSPVLGTWNVET
jgi:prevent-host-death family protein